eukprot:TRINITY_DN5060_c0_g1_i3.p1 TRINITY_DN5060_c0_g1~~TRINITY_DN5060_c0_g1_i3.p1  ORF type:complete len:379 (-),score=80.61 TRINITY_DN5060_c0_g1_i3:831-1967(-)
MIRRPPRSTLSSSSAASDVYKRQAPSGEVDPDAWWKRQTRVGSAYQAVVPEASQTALEEDKATLRWEPDRVSSAHLDSFLEKCQPLLAFNGTEWMDNKKAKEKSSSAGARKRSREERESVVPAEGVGVEKRAWVQQEAFDALHDQEYMMDQAEERVRAFKEHRMWTDEERAAFLRAIYAHNKDFKKVSTIVGTRGYKQTVEYYFTWWCGTAEHAAWKQAREASTTNEFGVPRNAEIVLCLQGGVRDDGGDGVVFSGKWGNSDTSCQLDFEFKFVPSVEPLEDSNTNSNVAGVTAKAGLWGSTPPSSPAGKTPAAWQGATVNNKPALTAAEWPPSGVYEGWFLNEAERVPEKVPPSIDLLVTTIDLLVSLDFEFTGRRP